MDSIVRDFRYALRGLRRTPGFTVAAVLTLALGIGANTAVFSVVDAVLLRPLTYDDPGRLVVVHETLPALGRIPVSAGSFEEWRSAARSFEQMALIAIAPVILTGSGEPERLDAARVSATLFPMLGTTPPLGRTFTPEEEMPGRHRVVALGDDLWRRRFGADPAIVGRTITLNDQIHEVVGVLPPEFRFPRLEQLYAMPIASGRPQLWMPFAIGDEERGENSFASLARLRRGVSAQEGRAELNILQETVARRIPALRDLGADVVSLQEQITGTSRDTLALLWAAVGVVLLIACGNIANLLLARASSRRGEIAVRAALGASRERLVRQAVVESLTLGVLGGASGVFVAYWSLPVLLSITPVSVPRLDEVAVDARTLMFAVIITTLAGIVVGILPAWRTAGANAVEGIRGFAGAATAGRSDGGLRRLMVIMQVALTVVCLGATGLLVHSLVNVLKVDRGFDVNQILSIDVSLSPGRYPDRDTRAAFARATLERIQNLPGVTAGAVVNRLPLNGGGMNSIVVAEGTEKARIPLQERPLGDIRSVNADYFRTFGIPLLDGRLFSDTDINRSVAVVSAATASRSWPGQNPIGKRFRLTAERNRLIEVIGVVGDVRGMSLESDPSLAVYLPYWQGFFNNMSFAIKTSTDPAAMASAVRGAISEIDRDIPIHAVRTMDDVVDASVARRRFEAALLMLFAAVAMTLAGVGIYGVLSYAVVQRTKEIGVRLALGASRGSLQRMVVRDALWLVLAGLALGTPIAVVVGFTLRTLLFGVAPQNPGVLAAACAMLTTVAMMAAYLPARHAAHLSPLVALRME